MNWAILPNTVYLVLISKILIAGLLLVFQIRFIFVMYFYIVVLLLFLK